MTKILACILSVMLLSTVYVYQHTMLIEYSYAINNSKQDISLLIDQNNALRYNISRLESPTRLDSRVVDNEQSYSYMPIDCFSLEIEKPAVIGEIIASPVFSTRVSSLLLSMFSLNNEAIAIEIDK